MKYITVMLLLRLKPGIRQPTVRAPEACWCNYVISITGNNSTEATTGCNS